MESMKVKEPESPKLLPVDIPQERFQETVMEPEPEERPVASPGEASRPRTPQKEPDFPSHQPQYLDMFAKLLSTEAALERSQAECQRQARLLRSYRTPADGQREGLLLATIE